MRYKSIVLRFGACRTPPTLTSKIRSKSTTKLKTPSDIQYSIAVKIPFYQVFAKKTEKHVMLLQKKIFSRLR